MVDQHPEKLICSKCQYENDASAEYCAQCGSQLLRTIPVSTQLVEPKAITFEQVARIPPEKVTQGAVTFLVAGYPEPLILQEKGDIVLGRRMPNEPAPTVDMTRFNGHLLGVSRRHAIISFSDEGYYTLEDLASTNGTWLNENKLPPNRPTPIRGGDQIRLGNLILFIYFSAMTSISLVDTQGVSTSSLTPQYWEAKLGPYLDALTEVQHVVDTILERSLSTVTIRSINTSSKDVVQVKLDGTLEAVTLVKELVDPWKRGRNGTAALLRDKAAKAPDEAREGKQPGGQKRSLHEDQIGLAKGLIFKVKPTLSGDQIVPYVQSLLGPLRILIDSSLEISDTPYT